MIFPDHLRELLIRPVLQPVGLWSEAAENLLLGTMAAESLGVYLTQIGGGPARGLFQMEGPTHRDNWENFLVYKADLAGYVRQFIPPACKQTHPNFGVWATDEALVYSMAYALLQARIKYYRVPEALPDANDLWALAHYWKDHYNTHHGAGTVEKFVEKWIDCIGSEGMDTQR